jgi:DegV family protein with EDD domain
MGNVVVVTDSGATVPDRLARELDIRVVPILLTLGDRTFRDGVDIAREEVYRWLRTGGRRAGSAAPSVGDFLRTYASVAGDAKGIASIHISPSLSAISSAALTAGQLIDGLPVRVVDCRTAAIGQGFVVLEAARAAAQGASLEEVVQRAKDVASRTHLLATIDDLEHLRHGGRIGGAASLVGTLLQIKPVLSVVDGRVEVLARPRTKSRAISTMLNQMESQVGERPVHAGVLHADVPDEAEVLRKLVSERFDCVELYVTELTPVMGVHTGPGVLGIAFYAD